LRGSTNQFCDITITFHSLQDDDVRNLFFGDFINPDANPRVYDEIQDFAQLSQVMDHYLDEFNQVRFGLSYVLQKFQHVIFFDV